MKKKITQACIVTSIFLNLSSVVFSQDNTWFIDKTTDLGLSSFPPGGVMGLDMTNDGYPDLLSVSSAGCAIYINTDDPNSANPLDRIFVDATAGSGLNITNVPIQMASAADFNNDGNIDIITNVWAPSSDSTSRCHIFMGDGSGHFTLKSNSGLEALGGMSGTALPILDFDKDGNLDLFIRTHYETGTGTVMPNYLMKGNGDGTFTNVSTSSGIASVVDPLFGANIADWNNDCNQDILTAPYLDAGFGDLWKNNGNNTFTNVATSIGYNPHWMTGDAG